MFRKSRAETPFWWGVAVIPPRASLIAVLAVILSLPAFGCVTVAEHRKLERRVMDMRRAQGGDKSKAQVADMGAELDDLRTQIRVLSGKLEEAQRTADRGLQEARKARREAAAAAIGKPTSPATSGEGASSSGTSSSSTVAAVAGAEADVELSDELKSYQGGLATWRSKEYTACIDRFRSFLQTYASSSRADDAAFWIADCHYKQGEFKNAVLRFDDVVRNYPTGNRAPDALYRQGESLLKLGPGFHEAARRAFERVLKEYPDSARATEAKKQLEARAG